MPTDHDRFDILFVCTGNICRSPMGELLLRQELHARLGPAAERFRVHSAGTHGLEGFGIDRLAGACMTSAGVDAQPFRARALTAEMVDHADLVLGATRRHRAAAVTAIPGASARCFTLLELARLVREVAEESLPQGDLVARAHALVAAAAARRGFTFVPVGEEDIDDPYGGDAAEFRVCAGIIAEALRPVVDALCGQPAEEVTA